MIKMLFILLAVIGVLVVFLLNQKLHNNRIDGIELERVVRSNTRADEINGATELPIMLRNRGTKC